MLISYFGTVKQNKLIGKKLALLLLLLLLFGASEAACLYRIT